MKYPVFALLGLIWMSSIARAQSDVLETSHLENWNQATDSLKVVSIDFSSHPDSIYAETVHALQIDPCVAPIRFALLVDSFQTVPVSLSSRCFEGAQRGFRISKPTLTLSISRYGEIQLNGRKINSNDLATALSTSPIFHMEKTKVEIDWFFNSPSDSILIAVEKARDAYIIRYSKIAEQDYDKALEDLSPEEINRMLQNHPMAIHLAVRRSVLGIPPPPPPPGFESSKRTDSLGQITVELSQLNRSIEGVCFTHLRTLQNGVILDELKLSMDAVGGKYGITSPVKIKNHLIYSAYGNYDGRTIIVNSAGHIYEFIGGKNFYIEEDEVLISFYESDLAGLAIFDLQNDKLFLELIDMDEYPESIYRVGEYRYFVECENLGRTDVKPVMDIDLNWAISNYIEGAEREHEGLDAAPSLPQQDVHCTCNP